MLLLQNRHGFKPKVNYTLPDLNSAYFELKLSKSSQQNKKVKRSVKVEASLYSGKIEMVTPLPSHSPLQ